MEQHNIDKRFKETVGNISRQPSADAWARLQAQMTPVETIAPEENRKSGFWLYIAAAITLVLASVATWQFALDPKSTDGNLAVSITQPALVQENEATPVMNRQEAKPEKMLAQNATEKAPKTAEHTLPAVPSAPKSVATAPVKVTKKANQESLNNTPAAPQVATIKTHKMKPAVEKAQVPNLEPVSQPELKTAQPELLATAAPEKNSSGKEEVFDLNGKPVIVVIKKNAPAIDPQALAQNEPTETNQDRDPVKLKDIFKQARNLKNGESVNLQDLGLQANSKLAMETRNFTQKFSKVLDL